MTVAAEAADKAAIWHPQRPRGRRSGRSRAAAYQQDVTAVAGRSRPRPAATPVCRFLKLTVIFPMAQRRQPGRRRYGMPPGTAHVAHWLRRRDVDQAHYCKTRV